ncbi:hypothetical protein [Streptacidiphilus anmyonensis]|uniref:hypothetical protein n=1 Tax=Streptacidiphilus anmyonensis TaxID=405782 RepID=UPI000A00B2EB|nr:hypothetical protein [Streptacidiphilus anmyonensis]
MSVEDITVTEEFPEAPPRGRRDAAVRGLRAAGVRFGPALGLYGVVKLVGLAVFLRLLAYSGTYRTNTPRYGGGAKPWDVLGSWDGWWYEDVAAHGYHPALTPMAPLGPFTMEQNSVAFFPLYPGAIRLVSEVTGLGLYGAGMLVSVVGSFVAAAGIYALTEAVTRSRRAGVLAAGLWAVFPASSVQWSVYSEALFTALAVWACYAVVRRRWYLAGVLTLLTGLTRPSAATLIAGVVVAALVALYRARPGGFAGPLFAVASAPLGLLGYMTWVGLELHDFSGYFTLQQRAWAHSFDWGQNAFKSVQGLLLGRYDYLFPYPTEDLVGLAVLMCLPVLVLLLLRLRPPAVLVVYTLGTLAMIVLSQQMFGTISRFVMPLFPLAVPLALALKRLSRAQAVVLLLILGALSGWYGGYAIFNLGVP